MTGSAFDDDFAAGAVPQLMDHLADADDVTYTLHGGAGVAMRAILGPEKAEENATDDGRSKRIVRTCSLVRDANSPYGGLADAALEATVTINSVEWAIDEITGASATFIDLVLVRTGSMERTGRGYRH